MLRARKRSSKAGETYGKIGSPSSKSKLYLKSQKLKDKYKICKSRKRLKFFFFMTWVLEVCQAVIHRHKIIKTTYSMNKLLCNSLPPNSLFICPEPE